MQHSGDDTHADECLKNQYYCEDFHDNHETHYNDDNDLDQLYSAPCRVMICSLVQQSHLYCQR